MPSSSRNVNVNLGSIVVCGGGEVGGETAHFLTQANDDITILEMQDDILVDMFPLMKMQLMEYINDAGIKVKTNATVSSIDEEENTQFVPANTIISAFGYKAYNPLAKIVKEYCDDVILVGSAKKARNALVAIQEGYDAGLNV